MPNLQLCIVRYLKAGIWKLLRKVWILFEGSCSFWKNYFERPSERFYFLYRLLHSFCMAFRFAMTPVEISLYEDIWQYKIWKEHNMMN